VAEAPLKAPAAQEPAAVVDLKSIGTEDGYSNSAFILSIPKGRTRAGLADPAPPSAKVLRNYSKSLGLPFGSITKVPVPAWNSPYFERLPASTGTAAANNSA
jgi:hypothetical protein